MTVLHVNMLALTGAPRVEVDRWEAGILADEVPCSKDASRKVLNLVSGRRLFLKKYNTYSDASLRNLSTVHGVHQVLAEVAVCLL